MKSHLEIVSDKYSKVIAQLQSDNLKLREALTTLLSIVGLTAFKHEAQRAVLQEAVDIGYIAIKSTPEQSPPKETDK